MTDPNFIWQLRTPTKDNPLRLLMSACLSGINCGYDGTAYGEYPAALKILKYDTVKVIKFCQLGVGPSLSVGCLSKPQFGVGSSQRRFIM